MSFPFRIVIAAGLASIATAAMADTVKLPAVADTNLSSHPSERDLNYGASSHIRLKGIEMWMLAKFDTAPQAQQQSAAASIVDVIFGFTVSTADKIATLGTSIPMVSTSATMRAAIGTRLWVCAPPGSFIMDAWVSVA